MTNTNTRRELLSKIISDNNEDKTIIIFLINQRSQILVNIRISPSDDIQINASDKLLYNENKQVVFHLNSVVAYKRKEYSVSVIYRLYSDITSFNVFPDIDTAPDCEFILQD